MEEADDASEGVGDVDDDQRDGSHVVGEDDREVDVPSLLVPFLNGG